MPHSYHKGKCLLTSISILVLFFLMGPNLVAQNQNPFDIKSRSLIDTTASTPSDSTQIGTAKSLQNSSTLDTQPLPTSPEPDQTSETLPVDPPTDDVTGTPPSDPADPYSDMGLLGEDSSRNLLNTPGQTESSWWYYLFDLVLLLFLLGAFLYDRKIFPPLKKAFLHENFLRFLYRDTYLRKPGIFLYLNIIFLLSLGFILFRIAQYFYWAAGFRDYLIIQGVVFLLFAIKHIALQFLSQLVDKPFEVKFYRYWMLLSAGLIGLWLIPVTLMISVLPSDYIFIALLICCIPLILLLIYRQIKAMMQAKFFLSKHFFHFFLYFCAVEVVPVLLLADILVKY